MSKAILKVSDMVIRFGGLVAVDGLSFEVQPKQIVTLMGPNGAGKTTAFNGISGYVPVASGSIDLDDRNVTGMAPAKIATQGLKRTFQNNGLCLGMSVLENVLLGLHLSINASLLGLIVGWPKSVRAEQAGTARAMETLDRLGIADIWDRVAGELSFGRQRLVEIARAIVGGARVLMLDEPAVGLTSEERGHVGLLLKELVASSDICVVMVEHVQDLVSLVSDNVVVMNLGKKIAEGNVQSVRGDSSVVEAYLGS